MRTHRIVAGIAFACVMALGAAGPAFAGLKINLVYIDKPPPSYVAGGGELREIMQVAAENWERVFKSGNGNWKLTIEFGWAALNDPNFFAQELMVAEGGNPSRITHSCIRFNTNLAVPRGILGFFADPTPRDNFEYLDYTAYTANVGDGWLNTGRVFSAPTGDASDRIDLLQVAIHEIGHALGLDEDYSGLGSQWSGSGPIEVKPPRPFAGVFLFVSQGPHLAGDWSLMVANAHPGERRFISAADALLLAQISSFNRPDLSEPSLDENGHGQGIPTTTVSSSSTCNDGSAAKNTGTW